MIEPSFAGGVILPQSLPESSTKKGSGWIVTVFNNESNTYEEVITILMLATSCSAEEASIETWEIDHFGECVAHRADQFECESVQKTISVIGIRVEATRDPLA